MKSSIKLLAGALVIIGLVSFMGMAAAQDKAAAAPSGQYKIGVIDRKAVLDGYKKLKSEYSKLQEEVDERQKEITTLSEKITEAKNKFDKEKETLSADVKAERDAAIQNDYNEYKLKLSKHQGEIDSKERLLMNKAFAEIDKAVEKIGNEQGYHLILEGSGARGVVWHSPTIDISQKVIEVLNSTP